MELKSRFSVIRDVGDSDRVDPKCQTPGLHYDYRQFRKDASMVAEIFGQRVQRGFFTFSVYEDNMVRIVTTFDPGDGTRPVVYEKSAAGGFIKVDLQREEDLQHISSRVRMHVLNLVVKIEDTWRWVV